MGYNPNQLGARNAKSVPIIETALKLLQPRPISSPPPRQTRQKSETSMASQLPPCVKCEQPGRYKCSRCSSSLRYCSAQCQKEDWSAHKKLCGEPTRPVPAADSAKPLSLHEVNIVASTWVYHLNRARLSPLKILKSVVEKNTRYLFIEELDGEVENWRQELTNSLGGHGSVDFERFLNGTYVSLKHTIRNTHPATNQSPLGNACDVVCGAVGATIERYVQQGRLRADNASEFGVTDVHIVGLTVKDEFLRPFVQAGTQPKALITDYLGCHPNSWDR